MQPVSREMQAMNMNINPFLNQQLLETHSQHQLLSNFDPMSSPEDFVEHMLCAMPSSASSFPWELPSSSPASEEPASMSKALMLQQQFMLSRGLAESELLPIPLSLNHGSVINDVADGLFESANPANDASVQALFDGFSGSLGQTSNQPQHFHQNFGAPAAPVAPSVNQPTVSGSGGGGTAAQPKQRVRARRGQATDPHSIAERLRRERIAERMKGLQELVPNANKIDKASMLDEIIDYVKFLWLQVKVLSMSRLGGGAGVGPQVADSCAQGRGTNGLRTMLSSNNNDSMTVTENQVTKLMEEDMGSAMQYLQGKGLCLMPISLATAISTASCHSRNPMASINNPLINGGDVGGPSSPNMSVLTVQSGNAGGETSIKDATSISKP